MNRVKRDIAEITAKRELFEALKDSTVLVTGATGFIGSMLVKSLLAADELYSLRIKVVGQIRDETKARVVYGDMFDLVSFVKSINIPCDYVIHTVSPTSSKYFIDYPVETIKASVINTIDALETARANGASMVYLSSMEQYGVPYGSDVNMSEDKIGILDHLNVRSSYSESKRLCECLCVAYSSEYSVNVKIARLTQTFGAGMMLTDNRMPIQFARAAASGEDIVLHTEGKSLSNFVYLTDAVTGILTVLEKGVAGQAYNICNDRETRSVRDIAELVAREVAKGKIKVRVDKKENMGYAPDVVMYVDSSKLRALDWDASINMTEAYCRLVTYLKENE